MRLTELLFRRLPQDVNKVPFKEIAPLKLKDRISSKNQKTTERGCLQQITLLLTCLEENEFQDKNCIPQIKMVQACYDNYKEKALHRSIQQEQIVPNSKNFTHKQITYLLRKYPTV